MVFHELAAMGKKRKAQQVLAPPPTKVVVEAEPPRKRTLLGLKPPPESDSGEPQADAGTNGAATAPVPFRNKEKTLVLCSRRITFRYVGRGHFCCYFGNSTFCVFVVRFLRFAKILGFSYRYRHLMMDIMALLPHSKKDVKVQAKDNKADTLNELADLKGCSSCLLFEVTFFQCKY